MLLKALGKAAVAVAVAGLIAACAGGLRGGADRPQAEARAAVAGLISDYERARAERFFERFDQARFPSFEGYRNDVRQFLVRARQVVLDIVVDGVDASAADVGVRMHWNKSWVDEHGMHKLAHGEGELVFTRQPSGGLALRGIHGASPF